MQNLTKEISNRRNELSQTNYRIADLVIYNQEFFINSNISQISNYLCIAESTIVRFCKYFGYKGFSEFKVALKTEYDKNINLHVPNVIDLDFKDNIAHNLLCQNIISLEQTKKINTNENILAAARLLNNCNKIMCSGVGASYLVAKDMYLKLLRLNRNAFINEELDTQKLILSQFTSSDLLIINSFSGNKSEMIKLCEIAKKNNIPIISITNEKNNIINELSTINLKVLANENDFRIGASSSRISQLYVSDILFYTYCLNYEVEVSEKLKSTYRLIQENY